MARPTHQHDLIRHYTLNEIDLSIIRQRRGSANRLGFAVHPCYMRYPGVILGADETPFLPMLRLIATQLNVSVDSWTQYGQRAETRREHLLELQSIFGFQPFTMQHYRSAVHGLDELAWQTDKGMVLASALIEWLRSRLILLPSIHVVERICAEAITRAMRRIYVCLTQTLTAEHKQHLDALLNFRESSKVSVLVWLRQSPSALNAKHILEHIDRLKTMEALRLPAGIERQIHQNRLLKLAREGGQMTAQHIRDLEATRRYATLVSVVLEARATVIDETVDLHDRIMGALFNRAKRDHEEQFQRSGKAINEKVRLYGRIGCVLLEAKQSGSDPFAAIESIISWEAFTRSVTEAQALAQSENFDYLHRIGTRYTQIRRYAPAFLEALQMKAAPAACSILEAVKTLKSLNVDHTRKVPQNAPVSFVKKRLESLVFTDSGVDRRYYELCTLSELKNTLRSGDIWVQGSRQFKDFNEYLLPNEKFIAIKQARELPLAVSIDCDQYLHDRLSLLEEQLKIVNQLAKADELPDALITESGLKITPLSDSAEALMQQAYGLLPHVKITELLMDVEEWTGFARYFTHLKSGGITQHKTLLLTTILADAINIGLTKMAESCPGMSYAKLAWLQAWHIRDETYSAALAELVNA